MLPQLEQAREKARQRALAKIKKAGDDGDWRAIEAYLKYSFHQDYQKGSMTNVNVNANAQAGVAVEVNDEERARLIEMREKALEANVSVEALREPDSVKELQLPAPSDSLEAGGD